MNKWDFNFEMSVDFSIVDFSDAKKVRIHLGTWIEDHYSLLTFIFIILQRFAMCSTKVFFY